MNLSFGRLYSPCHIRRCIEREDLHELSKYSPLELSPYLFDTNLVNKLYPCVNTKRMPHIGKFVHYACRTCNYDLLLLLSKDFKFGYTELATIAEHGGLNCFLFVYSELGRPTLHDDMLYHAYSGRNLDLVNFVEDRILFEGPKAGYYRLVGAFESRNPSLLKSVTNSSSILHAVDSSYPYTGNTGVIKPLCILARAGNVSQALQDYSYEQVATELVRIGKLDSARELIPLCESNFKLVRESTNHEGFEYAAFATDLVHYFNLKLGDIAISVIHGNNTHLMRLLCKRGLVCSSYLFGGMSAEMQNEYLKYQPYPGSITLHPNNWLHCLLNSCT